MGTSIVDLAKADVAAFERDKHADSLAGKMQQHPGSPMYLGEVAALLHKTDKRGWSDVAKHLSKDLAHRADVAGKLIEEANADSHANQDNAGGIRADVMSHLDRDNELYLERYVYDLHTVDKLRNINGISDAASRSHLGLAIGRAEVDGLITGADVVRSMGKVIPNSGGTGNGPDPLTGNAEQVVVQSTRDARGELDDARRNLQKLDEKLQRELREVGPALWDPDETDHAKIKSAQRRVTAYVDDFHSSREYLEAKARVDRCMHALHIELKDHGADIEAHSGDKFATGNAHDAAGVLVHTYNELATSPNTAGEALKWALQHESDNRFNHNEVVAVSRLAQSVLANMILDQARDKMSEGKGEPENKIIAAIERVETLVRPYHIGTGVHALGELVETLDHVKSDAKKLRSSEDIAKLLAPRLKALNASDMVLVARLGVGLGLMTEVADSAGKVTITSHANLILTAQIFYQRVDDFHQIAAQGAPKSHNAELTKKARLVSAAYEKFKVATALFAIAGGAVGIHEDVEHIKEFGADPAVAIKFVGDLASVVGGAISLFPPLAPIGEAIALAGTLVSLIGAGFMGDKEGDERRGDERQRLANPRLALLGDHGKQLAGTFTQDKSAGDLEQAQAHGLTVGQIRRLGVLHPYLFRFSNQFDGAAELFKYVTATTNESHLKAHLDSPYRESLFEFLNHEHDENRLGIAIGLAGSHQIGSAPDRAPPDLVERMIDNVKKAMPHAFGSLS